MPKDTVAPDCQAGITEDPSFFQETRLAFLAELQRRDGSIIATSHAFRIKSSEIARRAFLLDLLSLWQAADYDSHRKSDPNLPADIALEDVIFALREKHGAFGRDQDFLTMQAGLLKLKRDETWIMESFTAFLAAGERIFASCRDQSGVTSPLTPAGLDALDRTGTKILRENPSLRETLQGKARETTDRFRGHLGEEDMERRSFDIFSISRGEGKSPAWIAGKLLAMGLVRSSAFELDPVLDPDARARTQAEIRERAVDIAAHYASALAETLRSSGTIPEQAGRRIRLHAAMAESALEKISETGSSPEKLMAILDHLDRASRDLPERSADLGALSFAGHMRIHMDLAERKRAAVLPEEPARHR